MLRSLFMGCLTCPSPHPPAVHCSKTNNSSAAETQTTPTLSLPYHLCQLPQSIFSSYLNVSGSLHCGRGAPLSTLPMPVPAASHQPCKGCTDVHTAVQMCTAHCQAAGVMMEREQPPKMRRWAPSNCCWSEGANPIDLEH